MNALMFVCMKQLKSMIRINIFFHLLLATRFPPTGPLASFLRRLASTELGRQVGKTTDNF